MYYEVFSLYLLGIQTIPSMSFRNSLAYLFFSGPSINLRQFLLIHNRSLPAKALKGRSPELCFWAQFPFLWYAFPHIMAALASLNISLCLLNPLRFPGSLKPSLSILHPGNCFKGVGWGSCRAHLISLPHPSIFSVTHSCFDCCLIPENCCFINLSYPFFWLYKAGGLIGFLLLHHSCLWKYLMDYLFLLFCGLRCRPV